MTALNPQLSFALSASIPENRAPLLRERKEMRKELIKQVAIKTLKELAVALVFTAVTCAFVAMPAIPTLLIATVAILAFGVLLRSLTAYLTYDLYCEKQDDPKNYSRGLETCVGFLQYLNPINFSQIDTTTRDVLVHEGGHALAAAAVYQDARPKIEIFPFTGGVTRFRPQKLSRLGELLGRNNSSLIVSAAGPAASILAASINIGLAHRFRKKYPEFSRYCLCAAIASIAQHVIYALSALWTSSSGHDFIALWAGGVHPIASAVIIIAVPLIVKTGFFLAEKIREHRQKAALQAA